MKAKNVNSKPNEERRRLLVGLTALGGLSVTGSALSGDALLDEQLDAAPEEPLKPSGYRETRHVRDYYRSVRDL